MNRCDFSFAHTRVLPLLFLLIIFMATAEAADDECGSVADYDFVCGLINAEDPVCGNWGGPESIDFEKFMTCPRPFVVVAIDPKTMEYADLATSAAIQKFSNITMGLQVGDEIWIGTFAGDRVAYRSLY